MEARFRRDILQNAVNATILSRWQDLELPNAWLVAGCLFQTVWNLQGERPAGQSIKDYNLFYFDPSDLSEAAEAQAQARVNALLADLDATVEVANQARVHLWYPGHFGRPCPPLQSSEDGIQRFLVLETCLGIRPHECHAPFGYSGLYAASFTPNPLTPYPELFAAKVANYQARWPTAGSTHVSVNES
ncbi:MAG: nucleotidyltransferase family protein [Aquabacterium commune]|uniref:nucleotidyltransferase family protein n=1 Tax=Aquabacterium commune TaxID=70586 RepID=UPI003BB051C2